MIIKTRFVFAAVVTALALSPAAAWADTYVSPLFGMTFGGDAPVHKPTFGAGITFAGSSAGLELEYATTPNFFGDAGSNRVSTVTANIIGGGNVRGTGFKAFVVAGGGLVRAESASVAQNNFVFDLGAGLSYIVASHVGVRGDVRYYRLVKSATGFFDATDRFDFWRGAVSLLVSF